MTKSEPDKKIIEKIILLYNRKNYLESINFSNKILKEYPNSILVNNILGVIHTELKNYILAKKIFLKVVSLNPKYNDGYYNLANIYNKLDEEDKAIESYKKVIDLDQNYYKAYQGTITDTVKTEQMNEVIAHFENKGYTIARKSTSGTFFFWEITW